MTLVQFLRLVANHKWLMLGSAFSLAFLIFWGTRNEKKIYSSHTLINTGLVSGYSIEANKGGKIDYAYTSNELENLISITKAFNTHEELAGRLLARALVRHTGETRVIGPAAFNNLVPVLSQPLIDWLTVPGDEEATYERILISRDSSLSTKVSQLLYSKHELFGIEQVKTLKVAREGNSDMIRMTYSATDPWMCRETLVLMTEIFIRKHKEVKSGQSDNVVDFFEESTRKSAQKLRKAEDDLLQFRVENKIINYYEQTRYISAKKEDLDEMYQRELMDLVSADTALRQLELQLEDRTDLPRIHQQIAGKKTELTELTTHIARLEILTDSTELEKVMRMKMEADQIKAEIRGMVQETYSMMNSPEGLPLSTLLSQWLSSLLRIEEARARLAIIRQRKREFEEIYSQFAPWGSKLKRIEREIDVSEREFLENLHSYNQARLHKISMMMSTNLRVIDAPYLPTQAGASKRGMLIVVGFMAGLILPMAVVVLLEFLDNTLRMPSRAAEQTGLELAGGMPRIPLNKKRWGGIKYDLVRRLCVEQIIQYIQLTLLRIKTKPRILVFVSTRNQEGKTFISELVVQHFRNLDEKVSYLFPEETDFAVISPDHPDNVPYVVDYHLKGVRSIRHFAEYLRTGIEDKDWVVVEVPGILKEAFPLDALHDADLTLMVCRANKVWNLADRKGLQLLEMGTEMKPKLVVNATQADALEELIGEIPKRRSWLRKYVKRLASLGFNSGNKI